MATVIPKSYVGTVAAAAVVSNKPGTLISMTVNAASGAVLTVWDNASAASGTILAQVSFAAVNPTYRQDFPGGGLQYKNGITVTVATATAQVTFGVA